MAITIGASSVLSLSGLFEIYLNDVRHENKYQAFTAEVGDVIKFIPVDPLMGFKPGYVNLYMRQNNTDVRYPFTIVGDRTAVLNVNATNTAGYFRRVEHSTSPYTPPVVKPKKAPFTIPAGKADSIRTKASILVNDVAVPSGDVTVGIDQTLKFKANDGYEVSYAIIIFNDPDSPNGLQELDMTLSEGGTVASLKNNMLSSKWTFSDVLIATKLLPVIPVEPEKAPFTIPADKANAIRTKASILVNDVAVPSGEVTVGIDQTLKFVANDGYEVSYAIVVFADPDSPNGFQELDMDLSVNKTVASLKNDILSSKWTFSDVLLATKALPMPEKAPFTIPAGKANAIREYASILVDDVEDSTGDVIVGIDQTLKFKAKLGYSLDNGYIIFNDPDSLNKLQELEMVLSGDKSELTLKNDMLSSKWTYKDVLVSKKVVPLYEHTFTTNDVNLINNRNAKIYLDGVEKTSSFVARETQTVTIKTNEGYKFSSLPLLRFQKSTVVGGQIKYESVYLVFDEISETEASIVISDYSIYDMYHGVDLGVGEITVPPTITITQSDIDNAIANKATIYVDDEIITTDTVVNLGQEVKVIADMGWEFYERQGPNSVRAEYVDDLLGGFLYKEFELSPLNKEATFIVDAPALGYTYNRLLIRTKLSAIEVSGSNNVYLATDKTIRDVNNERYRTRLVTSGDQRGVEFFDYGDFILNIIDLPFSLEDKALDESFINLGDRTLKTKAPVIITDNVTLDMGTINIVGDGDSLDYQDVRTVLHLPWLSKVMIDASYVINQTIRIEYNVDMYTGDAVANIYSTAVGDETFLAVSGTIGTNIPHAGYKFYTNTPDNKGINTSANNNIRKAYIEVIKSDAPLKDDFFSASVSDAGVLTNESGYIEISNANLQFKALHTEKLDIINILRNGIIV